VAYYLYIIELNKKVTLIKKFKKQNPKYKIGERCFYVGQSAKAPMLRFKKHKDGYKSNSFVKRFGYQIFMKNIIQFPQEKMQKNWKNMLP
tara:strand:+ start:41 stop:310 length:270 start_codon:yes stop_codon:yes gene_type:complete